MTLGAPIKAVCTVCGLLSFSVPLAAQQTQSPDTRLEHISTHIAQARAAARTGNGAAAQDALVRIYLDEFEPLESLYGGLAAPTPEVANSIGAGEAAFHAAMANASEANFEALTSQLVRIRATLQLAQPHAGVREPTRVRAQAIVVPGRAGTTEIRGVLAQLQMADAAYRNQDANRALKIIEHTYLERIESLEPRLPRDVVERIERRIHLQLRPAIRSHASVATVSSLIGALGADLLPADRFLAKGGSVWFAVLNSFVIVLREGLEAVLLIAALLAYLKAIGAQQRHHRQIYGGVLAGVAGTVATWFLASTLLPISGANRELMEGVTALLAVGVLLYVAHWLFQKTYIHDWKDYLRSRLGGAVTRGSAFAMAALAFAAVYREGFETVLFYQALSFDAGIGPVLAGFVPGAVVITLLGFAIIRAGVKLPLKKVFAGTNAVLLYLAFVFIGKGLYNLQEAGVFAPHALRLPDHVVLRQLLGWYPLAETMLAQLAFLLLLGGMYLFYRRRMLQRQLSAQAPQTAPLPGPRAEARRA